MNTNETEKKKVQWTPPAGWFRAAIAGRREREDREHRIGDNKRRAQYGLPTYDV